MANRGTLTKIRRFKDPDIDEQFQQIITRLAGARGEIFAEDISTDIILAAQDTHYQVTAFDTVGPFTRGTDCDIAESHIKIIVPGIYDVNWHVSFRSGQSHKYEFGVGKNDGVDLFEQTAAHRQTSTAAAVGLIAGGGHCGFVKDDTVELFILRYDGGATSRTATIEHVMLRVHLIG